MFEIITFYEIRGGTRRRHRLLADVLADLLAINQAGAHNADDHYVQLALE